MCHTQASLVLCLYLLQFFISSNSKSTFCAIKSFINFKQISTLLLILLMKFIIFLGHRKVMAKFSSYESLRRLQKKKSKQAFNIQIQLIELTKILVKSLSTESCHKSPNLLNKVSQTVKTPFGSAFQAK